MSHAAPLLRPRLTCFGFPVCCRVSPLCAGVAQFVRRAFEDSISGILNKRQVDVLHDIKRKRAKGEAQHWGQSHQFHVFYVTGHAE